jgi:hypothetical protein
MDCKEHVLHFFLKGKISLSQYDYKFISNLQMMIHTNKRVTSNQADLFDRLLQKYTKQFAKENLSTEELVALPWKTMIVRSTPDYTGAVVSILGDNITIRVPFNKKFINEFRELKNNTFYWNKEDRIYKSKFNTEALKIATHRLQEYFSSVSFCENTADILAELGHYNTAAFWDPTLVRVHDNLFIAACNPVLGKLIHDIELKIDARTLYILSKYGIKADPNIIKDDPDLIFATNTVISMDMQDVDKTAKLLREIGCTHAIVGRGMRYNPAKNSISKSLVNHGIIPIPISSIYETAAINDAKADVILIQQNSNASFIHPSVNKLVILRDSTPVEVR